MLPSEVGEGPRDSLTRGSDDLPDLLVGQRQPGAAEPHATLGSILTFLPGAAFGMLSSRSPSLSVAVTFVVSTSAGRSITRSISSAHRSEYIVLGPELIRGGQFSSAASSSVLAEVDYQDGGDPERGSRESQTPRGPGTRFVQRTVTRRVSLLMPPLDDSR